VTQQCLIRGGRVTSRDGTPPARCHRHAADDERDASLIANRLDNLAPDLENHVEHVHVTRRYPASLMAKPGTWTAQARLHALTPRAARVQFACDHIGGTSTNSAPASGQRATAILTARQSLSTAN
jgi:hypothetical protein